MCEAHLNVTLGGNVFGNIIVELSALMSFVPGPHSHLWHLFLPLLPRSSYLYGA